MKTILVTNENVKAIASNDADKSVFEKYDYDIQIKNDGTLDELQQVATDFVQDLWKKEIKNVYENQNLFRLCLMVILLCLMIFSR